MYERQMWWKILLVGAAAAFAIQAAFPLEEKLKFGIDLYGGYSLLYEIDDTGLDAGQKKDIAEQVMKTLQERVDPEGVLNLVWRPVGANRLEIQMPRPSERVQQSRAEYDGLRDQLRGTNVKRGEILAAIARPPAERAAAIESLVRGVPTRKQRLAELVELEDALAKARALPQTTQSADAIADNEEMAETRLDRVLATNVDLTRVQTVLDAPPKSKLRKEELDKLLAAAPDHAELIKKIVDTHDAWRLKRGREGTLDDPADLERLLRGAGVLEFRMLAETDAANPNQFDAYRDNLKRFGPRPRPGEETFAWFEVEKPRDFFKHNLDLLESDFDKRKLNQRFIVDKYGDKYFVLAYITPAKSLTHRPGEQEWSLQNANPQRDDQGRPAVGFELDERGGARFDTLTRTNKGKLLSIFLDDKCVSYANIEGVIRTRGIIHGSFSVKEVQDLVKKLNAGSLPRKLKEPPISVRSIGPSLGAANRSAGLFSAYLGAGAVTAFMVIYYLYAGIIAVIALSLNVVMTLAVLGMLGATLTLPGVAGLVLSVGMAVDANVLINERIREEQDRGSGLRTAVRLGYERAFSAILDSNLTTFITSVILYWVASEEIKGFGLVLAAGVVLNLFTAVFVTRLFFEFMCMARVPRELIRNPLVGAAGAGILGGVIWAAAHALTSPEKRVASVTIAMGQLLTYAAICTVAVMLLMALGRFIHHLVRPDPNGRLPMLHFFGTPKVDWYRYRRAFYAMSILLTIGGMIAFLTRDRNQLYDIEFLGGTAAQIDLKVPGSANEADLEARLAKAADQMRSMADAIENKATITGKDGAFVIQTPGVPAARMQEFLQSVLGDWLNPNGIRETGAETVTVTTKPELKVAIQPTSGAEAEQARTGLAGGLKQVARQIRLWAGDLADAQVQAVEEVGATKGAAFEIVSRVTSKEVVVSALLSSMGDLVDIPQAVSFAFTKNDRMGGVDYFPIKDKDLAAVTGDPALVGDLSQWPGGVAIIVNDLKPPQSPESIVNRLKVMRLQPGFEKYGWRNTEVIPVKSAPDDPSRCTAVAVVVTDDNFSFEESSESSEAWRSNLAEPEVQLVRDALERQTSLGKITQFAPQVAAESKQKAYIALTLSWLAIIIYLWFRFGKITWGASAVFALIHDVMVAVGMIALSHFVAHTAIGKMLLIDNFRIDLAMVAALLTVVGYSVNDTIIVFDRIRENRGKSDELRPSLINNSINQTLSRTILTVLTVLIVIVIMYIFGGRGVHGFMFAMLVGILSGSYSSIFVASPLLVALSKRAAKPARGKAEPVMA